jgi:catechol 2,3-dioxygenase-like lactoylglutathione lyase family enzyme
MKQDNSMKRMHIHIGVKNIDQSIEFYNALFGEQPVKTKSDYAKWMLDDPRINFAISTRAGTEGVDHLGLQVDEKNELEMIRVNFEQNNIAAFDEGEADCCYARSEKSWVRDPSGVAWETYQTMADAQIFSEARSEPDSACCLPERKTGCC